MAASSQGGDDDEERRALELELAAELAALSAQDVELEGSLDGDVDQNDGIGGCGSNEVMYVRLDLDSVLKQVTETGAQGLHSVDKEHQVSPSSWGLLLQSVARSDREFFQPCREILHEIRTSILDVESPISSDEPQTQRPNEEIKGRTATSDEKTDSPSLGSTIFYLEEAAVKENGNPTSLIDTVTKESAKTSTMTRDPGGCHPTPPLTASDGPNQVVALPDVPPLTIAEDNQSALTAEQKQLEAIAKQHEARESRRLKAQARHEKERAETAQLLSRLEEEYETQERIAARSRQEAQERSFMAKEEVFCRQFAAAERENHEIVLMTLADEESHIVAAESAALQTAINMETRRMEAEDRAERHRMRIERHQRQKSMTRCHFAAVLLNLVKYHETQRQIQARQTKRERRENVQMRAEEASTRRIIAERDLLREQQERGMNHVSMNLEDILAKAVEDQERSRKLENEERLREQEYGESMQQEEKRSRSAWAFRELLKLIDTQNEEYSRDAMRREEARCRRAWNYWIQVAEAEAKERERDRMVINLSTGFQRLDQILTTYQLMKFLTRWKMWCKQSIEEDRLRSETVSNAAKRIHIWHRSCRQRLQQVVSVELPLVLEDFSDEEQPQAEENGDNNAAGAEVLMTAENQAAARRLQSTFRGFHVRRKFANALALAQVVEEGDPFDGVDLEDLIQLPPELVEGWEDPVLPRTPVLSHQRYPPISTRIDRVDHVENNEIVGQENDKNLERVKPESLPNPTKEQSLAATLWNKMKRRKQRQKHSQQERQRQLDPVCRVQKLLNRKPNNRNNSNQSGNSSNSRSRSQSSQGGQQATNMISWSSTTNARKKPKVKLPSLVERLRRQTMAER
ncbi:hypothetical protein GN244_ATG13955 [Phytophthora infestans]|uniref:Uncharacterized protein n=1 Tax=Phytophthora infestans TaxID=4787 RepID=A0A833W9N0_PHYIN|nr:hypothetical protein GN244_ATG13955 [Phytophthora infestans]KAF4143863.1 hypothetical protein GN958_ATG06949 [Phytophthora infestans]